MLDLKWIRENEEEFKQALKRRNHPTPAGDIISLDAKHREKIVEMQDVQEHRNAVAKHMGLVKRDGGDISELTAQGTELKEKLASLEEEERALGEELKSLLSTIPNVLSADVPEGSSEDDNKQVRTHGEVPTFSFTPKQHFEIGEDLGLMDFETASNMSGSRFVLLKGDLARLERALASFMLDLHTTEFGYREVSPPLLVNASALYGTSQLPKFEEDQFKTTDNKYLIPTAEVPLTNMVADKIVEEKDLPLRYTALTPNFRSEAGSAGKDTRGMLRQHQFYKVELVSITHPEESAAEHERLTGAAEEVLKRLEIPYRVQLLCSGDTGFGAHKTYDLEAWMPGQNQYREISSCSIFNDFQARRMNARFRPVTVNGKKPKPQYLHTLNGSGIAVGRALIAVLENFQQEDGSVKIPKVLQPYMNNKVEIKHEEKS